MHKPGTTDYKRERNAALYDRLNIVIPKGRKADVEAHVKREGIKSVNSLVNDLLREEVGMSMEEWNKPDVPAGEPIVSHEVFDQAQAAMKRRNQGTEKKED